MTHGALPSHTLADRPDLQELQRQAHQLIEGFRTGASEPVAEVVAHHPEADTAPFALHDPRLVLAHAYGFENWSRLEAYVEGATDEQIVGSATCRRFPRWSRPATSCPAEAARYFLGRGADPEADADITPDNRCHKMRRRRPTRGNRLPDAAGDQKRGS